MFILDTNTVIYFFKGAGRVRERLVSTPPAQVAVPAVVLYELEYGASRMGVPERRLQLLEALLESFRVLPFGLAEARKAAQIRFSLEKKGTPIGPTDILIAATALANHGVLVTHNGGEFSRVDGLEIVDWF